MDHLKSPTSARLQRWAMFMSQFSYEIVYKKGRLYSNADGPSRMTFEPTEVPTPAVKKVTNSEANYCTTQRPLMLVMERDPP